MNGRLFFFSPKITWHHVKKRQYTNKREDCRTLKPPCGVPRAAEAEELLCTAIVYFHVEVIETPVFLLFLKLVLLLVLTVMTDNHTLNVHTPSEV